MPKQVVMTTTEVRTTRTFTRAEVEEMLINHLGLAGLPVDFDWQESSDGYWSTLEIVTVERIVDEPKFD